MSSARRTRRLQNQNNLSIVDFCVTKYMMSDLERYHYKDLQTLAKESSCIPANLKREDLIRALDAYQKCDSGKLNTILDEIKKTRIQQSKSNRKKTKAKISYSKKKRKQPVRVSRKKPVENVNSAYSDTGKEPILYNRLVNHSRNDVYPDSTDGNTFNRADRVSYPMMSSGQQPHLIPEYSQRRTLGSITGLDNCYDGLPPLYDFHSSFAKSMSALTPYNAMPPKELTQNLKEIEPPYVPYFANSFFHPPFMQFPPFNRYNMDNFNGAYKHDNYYPTHAQHPLYYGSNLMPSNNVGCDQEQLRICSASQSTFYSKNFNQTSTMDIDCPSCLLPNVPELRMNSENNLNVPASWSQNSVVSTDSVRSYMPSNSNSYGNYSYQDNGTYQSQSQTNNGTVADGKSQNTEFDSGSDVDTISLSGDFVNLLDLHSVDKRPDTSIESFDLQDFTTCNSKSAYPPETAKYYDTRNTVECRIETCHSNTVCYENCNVGENLCNGNNIETQNGNSQLPSFSSLFVDSMMNGHPYTNFKQVSQSLSEIPNNSIIEKQYDPNNSVPVNYSQTVESNHIDLTSLPDKHPGQNEAASIPHSQMADSSELQVPSNGNSSEITSSTFNSSTLSCTSTENNEISCSDYINQIVPFQVQENSVNVPDEAQGAVLDSNSCVTQSFNNTSVRETVFKHDAGSLIYKSEKLHCSKIVCDAVSDNGIKEDIIRELVQIYIPKEKCETFDNPFSLIKVPSLENNNVKDEMQPSFVTESSQILETNTNIPFCHPCKYRTEGCRKISKIEHLQQHERACVFQPVYCPSDMCSWLKCMNLLSQHIYKGHKMELRYRSQFVYTIDLRVNDPDRSFYTFYQVHQKTIHVIRLHINDDKCIATVQYIPEIESSIYSAKGIMKLLSFSKKLQMKTWKGIIQPYLEIENQQQEDNTVQVSITNTDFVSLYVLII